MILAGPWTAQWRAVVAFPILRYCSDACTLPAAASGWIIGHLPATKAPTPPRASEDRHHSQSGRRPRHKPLAILTARVLSS